MARKHEVTPSPQLLAKFGLNDCLTRDCPTCGKRLLYKTVKGYEYSVKQNAGCRSCSKKKPSIVVPSDMTRSCSACSSKVTYKSKQSYRQAEKSGRLCRSCSDEATRRTTRSAEWRAWRSTVYREACQVEGSAVEIAHSALQTAAARLGGISKPERDLVTALASFGFAPGKVGRWRCDAVNHEQRAVVEVHGDWWHVRPGSRWEVLIRKNYNGVHPRSKLRVEAIWERDLRKMESVERLGYAYTVVWAEDVLEWLKLLDLT